MNTPVSASASPSQEEQKLKDKLVFQAYLPFEWIVSLRLLRDGSTQTAFIIGGVSLGVAVIIFMSALLSGLQANFVKRTLTGQAHIQLVPPKEAVRPQRIVPKDERNSLIVDGIKQAPLQRQKSIDQWQSIASLVRAMPEVLVVSPEVTGSALVVRGDTNRAISVMGIEPEYFFKIVPVEEKIVRGSARLSSTDILVGIEFAKDLGVTIGDKLHIATASGASNILTITGIFDLGNRGANSRTTYMSLRTAQSLLGIPGGVSALDITVIDVYDAERVAQNINRLTKIEADSWIKTNEQFFTAVNAQTTANTAIRFFVALSVAFGIASVLVVSVVQRSREIGILRAMGITRGQILRIFLLQGGLLGLGGAIVGSLLGMLGLALWQNFQRNADGSPMFSITMDTRLFLAAFVLASLTGLLAAFAPALRAARLDPVVAIRG